MTSSVSLFTIAYDFHCISSVVFSYRMWKETHFVFFLLHYMRSVKIVTCKVNITCIIYSIQRLLNYLISYGKGWIKQMP